MKKRAPCLVCGLTLAALAASAAAQESTQEGQRVLERARHMARYENQRVLVHLRGGSGELDATLATALQSRSASRTVRYEYQLVALPADSDPGQGLAKRFGLEGPAPHLAVVEAGDTNTVLGRLEIADASGIPAAVDQLLAQHKATPRNAEAVLAEGLAEAKKNRQHAFVYLSAPW